MAAGDVTMIWADFRGAGRGQLQVRPERATERRYGWELPAKPGTLEALYAEEKPGRFFLSWRWGYLLNRHMSAND